MKVCVLALDPLIVAGRGQRVAQALQARGHEIQIVTRTGGGLASRVERRATSLLNKLGAASLERRVVPGLSDLASRAAATRADVYHAIDLGALVVAAQARQRAGGLIVYDAYEYRPDEVPGRSQAKSNRLIELEKRGLNAAHTVIAVTESLAEALAEFYGIRQPQTVRNWPRRVALTPQPHAGVSVLYQGGAASGRGLEELLAAARHFAPKVSLTLRLIGAPDYLAQLTADLPACARLAEPTPPPEALAQCAAHDIGVIPTLPLSRGNAVALPLRLGECMMAGLAVVASDLPEIRRVVRAADCGLLVPPGDVAALTAAVNRLAENPAELARLKENARRAAHETCCWEAEQTKLQQIYDGLHAARLSKTA